MTTPELAKALERQQREAQQRRERRQQTVDRIRGGRQTTPGLTPLGDPDEVQRETMDAEVKRMRRRGMWLVAFAMLLAAVAVWQGRLVISAPMGLQATSGVWFTALGALVVTGLIGVRALQAMGTMHRIEQWSPESATLGARLAVRSTSIVSIAVSALTTLALVWMALGG